MTAVSATPVREPAVAGTFYPSDPSVLERTVRDLLALPAVPGLKTWHRQRGKSSAIAVISPHAGYQYSGPVAGKLLGGVAIPEPVVILGPNHTGYGRPFSLMTQGSWRTPLGPVPIATALARRIQEATGLLEEDEQAHQYEHSVEVQIPFLQVRQSKLAIVPIVLAPTTGETYHRLGEGIAAAVREAGAPVLLVASTDMTHYEPHETAKAKDAAAIDAMTALDPERLQAVLHERQISMCGYAPTIVTLWAARALGARRGRLVDYRTSGETTGDLDSVVGYAGVVIE